MSKPPVFPEQSASGIAVDPRTLERVVPVSRRPDGSVRKERKIRPGFTPQEDVSRFRGTRQAQMDAAVLPKGHIIGGPTPSSATKGKAKPGRNPPPNKNAKRRAQRNAAKTAKPQTQPVRNNWDEESEDGGDASRALPSGNRSSPGKVEPDLSEEFSKLNVEGGIST